MNIFSFILKLDKNKTKIIKPKITCLKSVMIMSFLSLLQKVCENNTYGANCSKHCSPQCAANNSCDKINGTCAFGCVHGYQGAFCDRGGEENITNLLTNSRNFAFID